MRHEMSRMITRSAYALWKRKKKRKEGEKVARMDQKESSGERSKLEAKEAILVDGWFHQKSHVGPELALQRRGSCSAIALRTHIYRLLLYDTTD